MNCLYKNVWRKMWFCLKLRFCTSCDITWYAEEKKILLSSHSIVYYFYWTRQGSWSRKIEKVWQRLKEWKIIMQVACFLNGSMVNFIFLLLYIKWFLKRNLKLESYRWTPNYLENFIVLMLMVEVSKC